MSCAGFIVKGAEIHATMKVDISTGEPVLTTGFSFMGGVRKLKKE